MGGADIQITRRIVEQNKARPQTFTTLQVRTLLDWYKTFLSGVLHTYLQLGTIPLMSTSRPRHVTGVPMPSPFVTTLPLPYTECKTKEQKKERGMGPSSTYVQQCYGGQHDDINKTKQTDMGKTVMFFSCPLSDNDDSISSQTDRVQCPIIIHICIEPSLGSANKAQLLFEQEGSISPHQPSLALISPHQPSSALISPYQPSSALMSPHQPSSALISPHQPTLLQLQTETLQEISLVPRLSPCAKDRKLGGAQERGEQERVQIPFQSCDVTACD